MGTEEKGFDWRIGYAFFCLVYASCVVYLGLDNFDKVHGEYRQAVRRLQPSQIEQIARQELVDQCRKKLKRRGHSRKDVKNALGVSSGPCLSIPEAILQEREKTVSEHSKVEQKKFLRKLIVFYITFGIFFLALPLYLLYLLLSLLIWVFKDIKFSK